MNVATNINDDQSKWTESKAVLSWIEQNMHLNTTVCIVYVLACHKTRITSGCVENKLEFSLSITQKVAVFKQKLIKHIHHFVIGIANDKFTALFVSN